jgi:hypothetical protein
MDIIAAPASARCIVPVPSCGVWRSRRSCHSSFSNTVPSSLYVGAQQQRNFRTTEPVLRI